MPGFRRRRLPRVTAARSLRALQKVFPSARLPDPVRSSSPALRRELKQSPARICPQTGGAGGHHHPRKPKPGPPRAAEHLELAEARRRLLEAESQRRTLCELENRVRQLHLVFVHTELQVAGQGEGLSRLGGGVGQAQLYIAVHEQRLKKSVRRHRKTPRILASALGLGGCVPWGRRGRRRSASAPPPAGEKLLQQLQRPPLSSAGAEDPAPFQHSPVQDSSLLGLRRAQIHA
ncbi:TMF-regulated nuclear protein 1 [Microcaecilia unicolor]|uniref:TMF-regulated nuclear protein 1 n=1 Tax=Microcaecilia unicolor TaxID=1415580 RepID=A0A6P7ZDE7_9AMPH|nr:TMF-regulated nuclear protein 1 [Microcaecilia unicolor]